MAIFRNGPLLKRRSTRHESEFTLRRACHSLISRYFVPTWVSRVTINSICAARRNAQELDRIDHERGRRSWQEARCAFSSSMQPAMCWRRRPYRRLNKPENLLPFLEQIIADKQVKARDAEAIRASAAVASAIKPKSEGGCPGPFYTRCDQAGANRGLSHDRVELTAAECKTFLPPANARLETTWPIAEEVAAKLLHYCYPPNPQWNAKACKVMRGTLKATLLAVSEHEATIKLHGEMVLRFPYTGKASDGRITAEFVGLARVVSSQTNPDVVVVWFPSRRSTSGSGRESRNPSDADRAGAGTVRNTMERPRRMSFSGFGRGRK